MRRADRISGCFWLIFGVMVSIESYRLGLGTLRQPGPGFLFFWAGIFLATMSLVILLVAWSRKRAREFERTTRAQEDKRKIILVLIAVLLYALLMETAGFIVLTFLLLVFLLGVVERKRWLFALFTSAGVTFASYMVFEVWLQTQLPKGILAFLAF